MRAIRKLLKMEIGGNAHSDRKLFALAHKILMGNNHISMKKVALRKIDEAMGCEEDTPLAKADIEQAIAGYIDFHNAMAGGEMGGEG